MTHRALSDSIEFTYADDDRDPTVPYFEGTFEIEYTCTDKGDCYDVDVGEITLTTGRVWFDDRGHDLVLTRELEVDAVAWLSRHLAERELAADTLRARVISHFERMAD